MWGFHGIQDSTKIFVNIKFSILIVDFKPLDCISDDYCQTSLIGYLIVPVFKVCIFYSKLDLFDLYCFQVWLLCNLVSEGLFHKELKEYTHCTHALSVKSEDF